MQKYFTRCCIETDWINSASLLFALGFYPLDNTYLCFSADSESKLLLWWFKVIDLLLRQIDSGRDMGVVVQLLRKLCSRVKGFGDDRTSAGLLGAIGLGKKSQLSEKWVYVTVKSNADDNNYYTCTTCNYSQTFVKQPHKEITESGCLSQMAG